MLALVERVAWRVREPIAQALDAVRARFGYDAVRLGQLSPPRRPQG